VVHVTRGLLEVLLGFARADDPEESNVVLAGTPADAFEEETAADPETPVLTHFYFPDAGRPVASVFGVDLATPAGSGAARFVSHPRGPFELTEEDDLAPVVLVAVPPWEASSVGAFDRRGRRLPLTVVDAEPPAERLA
jgi:proteasome lid subunit RPN8/RPN11